MDVKKIIVIPALVATLGVGTVIGATTLLTGNAQEKKVLTMQEIEKSIGCSRRFGDRY